MGVQPINDRYSLDQLVWSAAEDRPADVAFARPLDMILELWAINRPSCLTLLAESIPYWKDLWEIPGDIAIAAEYLNDAEFYTSIYKFSKNKKCPLAIRRDFASLLVSAGYEESIADYETIFRKLIKTINERKMSAFDANLGGIIMEICKYRLNQLMPVLVEIKSAVDNRDPRFGIDFGDRAYLNAAVLWFRNGIQAVIDVVESARLNKQIIAAHVYCIGCDKKKEHFGLLREAYFKNCGFFPFGQQLEIRMACVEAIVYSASRDDANSFLFEALQRRTSRWSLNRRRWKWDVWILLCASYHMDLLREDLRSLVMKWLESNNDKLAVSACIALAKHGVNVDEKKVELSKQIKTELDFLRDNPSPLRLMPYRLQRYVPRT